MVANRARFSLEVGIAKFEYFDNFSFLRLRSFSETRLVSKVQPDCFFSKVLVAIFNRFSSDCKQPFSSKNNDIWTFVNILDSQRLRHHHEKN